ncbi:hypothetical protein Q9L58_009761 [Maublancomyces gigas]|uniref:Uncharacterized protein n=1 Tax=Discina gigas TaxID=1032678 RepID=A0ABR3G5Z5_9PEZI
MSGAGEYVEKLLRDMEGLVCKGGLAADGSSDFAAFCTLRGVSGEAWRMDLIAQEQDHLDQLSSEVGSPGIEDLRLLDRPQDLRSLPNFDSEIVGVVSPQPLDISSDEVAPNEVLCTGPEDAMADRESYRDFLSLPVQRVGHTAEPATTEDDPWGPDLLMGDNDDQADRMELDGPIDLYGEEICVMHHTSDEIQNLEVSSDQESINSKAEEFSSEEEESFTYGHIKFKMTIQEIAPVAIHDLKLSPDYPELPAQMLRHWWSASQTSPPAGTIVQRRNR